MPADEARVVSGSESTYACRWFEIRAEHEERVAFSRKAAAVARMVACYIVTRGIDWGDYDPRRFCDVLVLRRDTQSPVARYCYDRLGEASDHVVSLQLRLTAMHVYDFCRELSIPVEAVEGAGSGQAVDEDLIWVPVRERRPQ